MKYLKILILIFATQLSACQGNVEIKPRNECQNKINHLTQMIKNHEVGAVEIRSIPSSYLLPFKVKPELIDRSFEYEIVINHLVSSYYEREVLQSISSISVTPAQSMGDLRWSASFFDDHQHHIVTIYLDSSGREGGVDSQAVSLQGDFGRWLDLKFSSILK